MALWALRESDLAAGAALALPDECIAQSAAGQLTEQPARASTDQSPGRCRMWSAAPEPAPEKLSVKAATVDPPKMVRGEPSSEVQLMDAEASVALAGTDCVVTAPEAAGVAVWPWKSKVHKCLHTGQPWAHVVSSQHPCQPWALPRCGARPGRRSCTHRLPPGGCLAQPSAHGHPGS